MKSLAQVSIPGQFFSQQSPGVTVLAGSDVTTLIAGILPNVILLAGIIFVALIIVGGWGIITSAGEDQSPQDKAKAKATLTYGLIGFLLVVSAYFILQAVGVITGIDFLTIGNKII